MNSIINPGKNENNTGTMPGLAEMFLTFFRIGLFTFGGGLAMVGVIRHELKSGGWLSEEEFVDSLAIATAFPGAIAINTSLVVGHRLRGCFGALTALMGVVLPSFITILLIAFFFMKYFSGREVTLFFKGAGASVAGLILYTALDMGKTMLKSWKYFIVFLVGIVAGLWFNVNPLWIILISAVVGYFIFGGDEINGSDS